jgi:hypothetical protein
MNRGAVPDYKYRFAVNLKDHSITVKVFDQTTSQHNNYQKQRLEETKPAKAKPDLKEIYRFGERQFDEGVERVFEYIDHIEAV